ncbi:uncharacterized protein LOC126671213 [Mercurialis annua]|uniref:uncharacterized protein LOC126671213 n=1 Tax=Mercurialis annua TaxID=3986 RepID=UPI00215DD768|nr:uncharacterized protein LOC126671213 [Mercurialis annua]
MIILFEHPLSVFDYSFYSWLIMIITQFIIQFGFTLVNYRLHVKQLILWVLLKLLKAKKGWRFKIMKDKSYTRRSNSIIDLEIGGSSSSDQDKLLSSDENNSVEVWVREGDENVADMNGIMVKEKRNAKPPRPPRGPLLDAADMKWLREISELARLKHARMQRIKALKKRKRAEKGSSSSSCNNIWAMVVTVVFFCVIFFQGFLASHV